MSGRITYGPSPKMMTPFSLELVEELKQRANFLLKLKAAANCVGKAILLLPRPAMPVTPLARPLTSNVAPQVKIKLGTLTTLPGLDPSVDCRDTTSWPMSPCVEVLMMGFPTL